jgi:2-polyprenyl-6-methoxyphenol hydroxylase-like FAD-dependent oxidoreductase
MAFRSESLSVLVLGGGPAGLAATAELAQLGMNVTLIERDDFSSNRIGEHVRPSTVQRLRTMGMSDVVTQDHHLAASGIDAWWGSSTPHYSDYLLHPVGHGLNLSRPYFDRLIANHCRRRGAKILAPARILRAQRQASGWDVEIAHRGRLLRQRSAYLVDATGRAAVLARMQGATPYTTEKQIAIIGFGLEITDSQSSNRRVLVETARDGWWYFAPLSASRCVCMFVTDPAIYVRAKQHMREWWTHQLKATVHVKRQFARYRAAEEFLVRLAQSQRLDKFCGSDWVAVGDAAVTFDPLSSEGIAKAIDDGNSVAAAICKYLGGDSAGMRDYCSNLSDKYAKHLTARTGYYRLEQRWGQSEFWGKRQLDPVFLPRGPTKAIELSNPLAVERMSRFTDEDRRGCPEPRFAGRGPPDRR